MRYALVLLTFIAATGHAAASCRCACVGGRNQAICTQVFETMICPPMACGVVPPNVAPVAPPMVPPVGTRNCRQQQVQDPATGRFSWKMLCN